MKRLVIFTCVLFLFLSVTPCFGSIAHVRSCLQGSTDSNGFTSSACDTSTGNFLYFAYTWYEGATEPTYSSTPANTWTPLTDCHGPGSEGTIRIVYAKNATVDAAQTFTLSCTACYPTMAIGAFSGVDTTSPFDKEVCTGGNTGTTIKAGSVTPTNANALLVTVVGGYVDDTIHTVAIDSSFNLRDKNGLVFGQHYGVGQADKIVVGGPSAQDPEWSGLYEAGDRAATTAVFNESTGGAAAATPSLALTGVGK